MSRWVLPAPDAAEWMPSTDRVTGDVPRRVLWLAPVALAGGVGWAVGGYPWGLAAAATSAVAAWGWVRVQGRLALRSVRAVRVGSEQAPRLLNIAEGLARGEVPALWVIPDGGPNALVCWARGPAVAVSQSLLDGYSRTELEAVVAHCYVRLPDCAALSEALALGRLRIGGARPWAFSADAAAAALTRYPPALASAISKAEPRSDRFAPLWFVSEGSDNLDRSTRRERLLDL